MGSPRSVARAAAAVVAAALASFLASCQPVGVFQGQTTFVDIAARRPQGDPLNILGIGTAREDGRIVLRTTGAVVARGETATVGVMGPGMVEGTAFAVVGIELGTRLVRYAMTEGGGVPSTPAAVLAIDVPADTPAGLYSIIAFRSDFEYSIFSGGLEVR
jgi:hypothetical protein